MSTVCCTFVECRCSFYSRGEKWGMEKLSLTCNILIYSACTSFQGVCSATSDIVSKCGDNLLLKYRQPTEVDMKGATICENDNPFFISTKRQLHFFFFDGDMTFMTWRILTRPAWLFWSSMQWRKQSVSRHNRVLYFETRKANSSSTQTGLVVFVTIRFSGVFVVHLTITLD